MGLKLKTEEETGANERTTKVNQDPVIDDDWLTGPEPYSVVDSINKQNDFDISKTAEIGKKNVLHGMSDSSNQGVDSQMEEVALDFSKQYGAYYRNQKSDVDLLELTTQPFWQSMGLSKRRLREKGLTLEVDMIPERTKNSQVLREHFKANKRPMVYKMKVQEDGQFEYGNCVGNALVRRRFVKDGKQIYKKVTVEQHVATCLKSQVRGDEAVCPNCGYVGKIASYIDGCDACGSKFTVNDFEPKVSGFSFEQNPYIQFKNLAFSVNGMMCLIFLFTMLAATVFMFVAPSFKGTQWIGFVGNAVFMGFFASFVGAFILALIVFLLSGTSAILKWIYGKSIRGEDAATDVVPNISVNDFYQNMEYKIRNIHFSDNEKATNGFAKCRLSEVLPQYKDVVDCNMTYLSFVDGRKNAEGYHFDCIARIHTTKYDGKKIRHAYENVTLGVRGKKNVVDKPVTSMRMYTCKNCGSTLNLLEGAICKFCGSEYDLEEYDWVIDRYETKQKKLLWPIFVRIAVVLLYIGGIAAILGSSNIGMDNNIVINGETIYESTREGS